jgi:prohibitin 1
VRAEGEAEAATIISRALNKAGEGLVQFRRIEASKDIAGTLANVSELSRPRGFRLVGS